MDREKVLTHKVIDNTTISMIDAFSQLLPLGKKLDIAVGYFFLSGYELVREDFNRIAVCGGARIIIGNKTNYNTRNEIHEGVTAYNETHLGSSLESLSPQDAISEELINLVPNGDMAKSAWQLRDLIQHGKVEVRIYTGNASYFHSKLYLIERSEEFDGFAIVGSSNFSKGGFTGNSELNVLTMDSFPSLKKWFDALWESKDVQSFDSTLVSIIENNVAKPAGYSPPDGLPEEVMPNSFTIPPSFELRDYQKEAIKTWFRNNGCGILEMATGTGKTNTSLAATAKLYEHKKRLALIIVCPYQHLVMQWQDECKEYGLNPILGFESKKKWENSLNSAITSYNSGAKDLLCLITTMDTFSSQTMTDSLAKIRGNLMLLVDECHHLGSAKTLNSLSDDFDWRLGLSATPQRWHDESGSTALSSFFKNGVIFKFTLKDAIGKYLTRYYYYPHLIYLTEEENEEYLEVSEKIGKICAISGTSVEDNQPLKLLLLKRSRIINKAANKLPKLAELIEDKVDSKYNLFYCGDAIEDGERQVDRVIQLLGNNFGMKVHPFTSLESKKDRIDLLSRFSCGKLQGLVAIKCLDEGIDIPATKTAYILASSTNPREFIQRRGRILRKSPGKKYAYIHDFIVVPRDIESLSRLDSSIFNIERKLVKKELTRFKEFAELAENGPQAVDVILELAKSYNLLDI